jgi:MinD-like ATPase involved in chromosome partitioning or flagellar assembly
LNRFRIATVAGDPDIEPAIASGLSTVEGIEVVLRCLDRTETLAAIRSGAQAIVCAGLPGWLDLELAREARLNGCNLVAVLDDAEEVRRAERLNIATLPRDADLPRIMAACVAEVSVAEPAPPIRGSRTGRLITVWGPKGAPGRSTIAIELAAQLASSYESTILADADTYGGDILQMLGVVDEIPSIVWAARMAAKDELHDDRLSNDLRPAWKGGPALLPGIARPELWAEISESAWSELLRVMIHSFAFAVCDAGFCFEPPARIYPESGDGRNAIARISLREANHVVAVCRADPVGIKSFLWALEPLKDIVDLERVFIVVNRVRSGEETEIGDLLQKHCGKRPVAFIPDNPRVFEEAIYEGRSVTELKPRSDVALRIRSLTTAVGGRVPASGFLSRLSGRHS